MSGMLKEKILGALYGTAAGDALGYAIEFLSWERISQAYGPRGIREYALNKAGLAEVSDDTQMTLFTAAGLVLAGEEGVPFDEAVFRAYRDWLSTQKGEQKSGWTREQDWLLADKSLYQWQAPGNTCLHALGSGTYGTPERPINESKGCGGVMRTSVCGFASPALFPDRPEEQAAALAGAQAAAVTHGHPMGWVPAAMMADMVYRIVYLNLSIPEAAEAALRQVEAMYPKVPGMADFRALVERALYWGTEENSQETTLDDVPWDMDDIQELGGGWVGDEALAIAIYCACRYANDFDACIRAAVNHSGDSDSTGAIAGALVGASLGIGGISSRWTTPLDVKAAIEATAGRLMAAARPL